MSLKAVLLLATGMSALRALGAPLSTADVGRVSPGIEVMAAGASKETAVSGVAQMLGALEAELKELTGESRFKLIPQPAISRTENPAREPVEVTVGTEDAPKSVAIVAGQSLAVKIKENAGSTGFMWSLNKDKCGWEAQHVLVFRGDGHQPLTATSKPVFVGRGKYHIFYFTAVGVGNVRVCFDHKRPWEGGESLDGASLDIEVTAGADDQQSHDKSSMSYFLPRPEGFKHISLEAGDKKLVNLEVGDELVLDMRVEFDAANTGLKWVLDEASCPWSEQDVFGKLHSFYVDDRLDESGGKFVFAMRAESTGDAQLCFQYKHPESDSASRREVSVSVNVSSPKISAAANPAEDVRLARGINDHFVGMGLDIETVLAVTLSSGLTKSVVLKLDEPLVVRIPDALSQPSSLVWIPSKCDSDSDGILENVGYMFEIADPAVMDPIITGSFVITFRAIGVGKTRVCFIHTNVPEQNDIHDRAWLVVEVAEGTGSAEQAA